MAITSAAAATVTDTTGGRDSLSHRRGTVDERDGDWMDEELHPSGNSPPLIHPTLKLDPHCRFVADSSQVIWPRLP